MGCCGGGSQTAKVKAVQNAEPVVTGYAVELRDGRVLTFTTEQDAQDAHAKYGAAKPVRKVLGWL